MELGSNVYMAQFEHRAGPDSRDRERTGGRGEKTGEVREGERTREKGGNMGEPGDAMLGKGEIC